MKSILFEIPSKVNVHQYDTTEQNVEVCIVLFHIFIFLKTPQVTTTAACPVQHDPIQKERNSPRLGTCYVGISSSQKHLSTFVHHSYTKIHVIIFDTETFGTLDLS